jgi:hypothetical protein
MKDWYLGMPRPAQGVLTTLAGVALLLLLMVLSDLLGWYFEAGQSRGQSVARIERLLGYVEVERELSSAARTAGAALHEEAYPIGLSQDQAGAQLLEASRALAEEARLVVSGSQLLEATSDEAPPGFERLNVQLQMGGVPLAIDEFLGQIMQHSPMLTVETLSLLMPPQRRRAAANSAVDREEALSVKVRLYALREVAVE